MKESKSTLNRRNEDRSSNRQNWGLPLAPGMGAAAKSLQSYPTLCNPIDGSPPGSPVPGILQARTLEWVAISFSNAWKWKVKVKSLNCAWLLATLWTTAYQAPPSMGFSRQEYWSGLPLPSPRHGRELSKFQGSYSKAWCSGHKPYFVGLTAFGSKLSWNVSE